MATQQPNGSTRELHPCADPATFKPLPLGNSAAEGSEGLLTTGPAVQSIYNKSGEIGFFATTLVEATDGAGTACNNCYKTCTGAFTGPTACVKSLPACRFNVFGCVGCCLGLVTGCTGEVVQLFDDTPQSGGLRA